MTGTTAHGKRRLALLLAWNAGLVDGTGFALLSHVFTAHMSGNSVGMGWDAGAGHWARAAMRAFPIPFFFLGLLVGGMVVEGSRRAGVERRFSLAAGLEFATLLALLVVGRHVDPSHLGPEATVSAPLVALGGLSAIAMGIQSAAFRRAGPETVRTTFVTGMLMHVAESTVDWIFARRDEAGGGVPPDAGLASRRAAGTAALYGGIWVAYVLGAILSGVFSTRWRFDTLVFALAGIATAIGWDIVSPIQTP